MHAVVFENGVFFFHFMRSTMLPFTRSIMGCAESGPWNAYFYSVSGGNPGPVILVGAQNIGRDLGAPCRKWGCSKHIFALYIWHVLLGWIGCETDFFFAMCKNAQNCRENGFSTLSVSNLQHEGQNRGFGKKGQNIFLVPHPSSFLCFLVSRLVLAKNGVSKIDEISLKPLKT